MGLSPSNCAAKEWCATADGAYAIAVAAHTRAINRVRMDVSLLGDACHEMVLHGIKHELRGTVQLRINKWVTTQRSVADPTRSEVHSECGLDHSFEGHMMVGEHHHRSHS
jgi:hypothetical protein